VEQKRSIAIKVLKSNPAVFDWVRKGWVRFCIYDYAERKFYFYGDNDFKKLELPDIRIPDYVDLASVYRGSRDSVGPALIRKAG
jgi:hypothetical protein